MPSDPIITVITGANRGLGRAAAQALATMKDHLVVATARDPSALELMRSRLNMLGRKIECHQLDVTDDASCRSAIEEAASGLGGVDALVYTPAIGPLVRLADTDAATWRRVFDTNVTGAMLTANTALPGVGAQTPLRHLRLSEPSTKAGLISPSTTSIGPDCVATRASMPSERHASVRATPARPSRST